MAVSGKMYGSAISKAFNKEVDWDTDTIKVALVSSAYVPNQDTHDYFDDVSANEVTGTGYVAGGVTLANKTNTYDGATNTNKLDANDITWASSTITARYAIIYVATGVSTTSTLLGYVDFGQDESSTDGNFTVVWNASGIFNTVVA